MIYYNNRLSIAQQQTGYAMIFLLFHPLNHLIEKELSLNSRNPIDRKLL